MAERNIQTNVPKITVYNPPSHIDENLLYAGSAFDILRIRVHKINGKPNPNGRMSIGKNGILILINRHADMAVKYKPAGKPASDAYL